jgi:hypothetical protein
MLANALRSGPSRRQLVCVLGLLMTDLCKAVQAAPTAAEMARIERLLGALGTRRDLRMIRNGSEYDCDTAVTFLRRKLASMGDEVKTAEDFIERIASRSSTSGKPYLVRLSDGKEITAGEFLRLELVRLERPAAR